MNKSNPIKIIIKYKNDNKNIQYLQYIFMGKVSSDIKVILEKITELNLYDTLITLTKTETQKMLDIYGEKWYMLFFNKYHINNTIEHIKENTILQKTLISKFGQNWYDINVKNYDLLNKKIIHSYDELVMEREYQNSLRHKETGIDTIVAENMEEFLRQAEEAANNPNTPQWYRETLKNYKRILDSVQAQQGQQAQPQNLQQISESQAAAQAAALGSRRGPSGRPRSSAPRPRSAGSRRSSA